MATWHAEHTTCWSNYSIIRPYVIWEFYVADASFSAVIHGPLWLLPSCTLTSAPGVRDPPHSGGSIDTCMNTDTDRGCCSLVSLIATDIKPKRCNQRAHFPVYHSSPVVMTRLAVRGWSEASCFSLFFRCFLSFRFSAVAPSSIRLATFVPLSSICITVFQWKLSVAYMDITSSHCLVLARCTTITR